MRDKHTIITVIIAAFFLVTTLGSQVSPLPSGNLVFNPWFRDFDDPSFAGFSGWVPDQYWGLSQKGRNPTPDKITAHMCNGAEYCGTMARLVVPFGNVPGNAVPGVPAYLSQVVTADSSVTRFTFGVWWVTLLINPAEIRIYGGESANGPWNLVWTPFSYSFTGMVGSYNFVYRHTGYSETEFERGYSHYKVELYALPITGGQSGVKFTGVYFGYAGAVEPDPDPDPDPECLPTGSACTTSSECCSEDCRRGICQGDVTPPPDPECKAIGEPCLSATDCCSGDCMRGQCWGEEPTPSPICLNIGEPCSIGADCCSGDCRRGQCVAGDGSGQDCLCPCPCNTRN